MNKLRQAFREAVGEKVEKHDDLISRELPPDIDHADIRWDLIDISATTAQAYNTAIDQLLSKEDQIVAAAEQYANQKVEELSFTLRTLIESGKSNTAMEIIKEKSLTPNKD